MAHTVICIKPVVHLPWHLIPLPVRGNVAWQNITSPRLLVALGFTTLLQCSLRSIIQRLGSFGSLSVFSTGFRYPGASPLLGTWIGLVAGAFNLIYHAVDDTRHITFELQTGSSMDPILRTHVRVLR